MPNPFDPYAQFQGGNSFSLFHSTFRRDEDNTFGDQYQDWQRLADYRARLIPVAPYVEGVIYPHDVWEEGQKVHAFKEAFERYMDSPFDAGSRTLKAFGWIAKQVQLVPTTLYIMHKLGVLDDAAEVVAKEVVVPVGEFAAKHKGLSKADDVIKKFDDVVRQSDSTIGRSVVKTSRDVAEWEIRTHRQSKFKVNSGLYNYGEWLEGMPDSIREYTEGELKEQLTRRDNFKFEDYDASLEEDQEFNEMPYIRRWVPSRRRNYRRSYYGRRRRSYGYTPRRRNYRRSYYRGGW